MIQEREKFASGMYLRKPEGGSSEQFWRDTVQPVYFLFMYLFFRCLIYGNAIDLCEQIK